MFFFLKIHDLEIIEVIEQLRYRKFLFYRLRAWT